MKLKVHEAIARALIDAGSPTVFGILGDGNMQYCAGYMSLGGRFVGAIHEGNALSMADGYARESDRTAVVSVTHGPAVTNTATALTEAVRARSPILLLTGDTPPIRDFVQRIDLATVAALSGAEHRRVLLAEHVVDDVIRALRHVGASRVPMILDIPYSLLNQEIDYEQARAEPLGAVSLAAPVPDAEQLDRAVGILASARRPVVLAGAGAMRSGARDELVALGARLGAPLATSLLAKDLFAGEPGDLGVCGTVSHDVAIDALARADCLVVFGASLNDYTASHGDLLRGKAIIHCDVSPTAIGRYFAVDAGLVGDAAATSRAIREMLDAAEIPAGGYDGSDLRSRLSARDPRHDFDDEPRDGFVDMRTAMISLDLLLPRGRSVVTDTGRFMQTPWKYLHVGEGGRFHHTINFGSIGLGLPTAIGVALARRSDVTVAVAGDGGVAMAYMELATAVRESVPLVVVVLNDGCYGAEYTKLSDAGLNPAYSVLAGWPDCAAVARSLGCEAVTVTSDSGLKNAVDLISEGRLPLVIDVRADPTVDVGVLR
jgi:thiamine pyrophosphate-dependent acetolactate synthase large subunit-like protein